MTCQHSTFKNNDDFHSFTRETKRSLMQRVQQRLIMCHYRSHVLYDRFYDKDTVYLSQSHHSTSAILASEVSPRGVEDRLTSVASMANVESCD